MKKLAYLVICLCLLTLFTVKSQADWGDWGYLPSYAETPFPQTAGTAMCYALHEGEFGELFALFVDNNENEFYHLLQLTQEPWYIWEKLKTTLPGPSQGYALAGYGANLCYFGDPNYTRGLIFCTKGGGTNEFWVYDISLKQWKQLTDIPGDDYLGKGMGLATGDLCQWGSPPQTCISIYCLKGVNAYPNPGYQHSEFYVYHYPVLPLPRGVNPLQFGWERLPDFLHGSGANITYVPGILSQNALYAFAGLNTTPPGPGVFMRYSISSRAWTAMAYYDHGAYEGSAFGSWGVAGNEVIDGEYPNIIYSFMGGGATSFFDAYFIGYNTWDFDCDDPTPVISVGSDLASGYAYERAPAPGRCHMWAFFGGGETRVGFFYPYAVQGGGGQELSYNAVEQGSVQISPNPASERTVFKLLNNNTTNSCIEIYDNTGKLIQRLKVPTGSREVVYNMKNADGKKVPSGVYFYSVYTSNKQTFGKLIIQR